MIFLILENEVLMPPPRLMHNPFSPQVLLATLTADPVSKRGCEKPTKI